MHIFRTNGRLGIAGVTLMLAAAGMSALALASCRPADDEAASSDATSSGSQAREGDSPGSAPSQEAIDKALLAAEDYLSAGETSKAEAILLELIEQVPTEAAAHELLGRVVFRMGDELRLSGDLDGARTHFTDSYDRYRTVVALAPDIAGYQQSAGEIALMAGELDAAVAHFHRAGELDPLNPKHPLFESQLLLQSGELEKAAGAIRRALALDPEEPFALATLAALQMEQGHTDEALKTIHAARDVAPDQLGLRVMEAKFLRQIDKPGDALSLLRPLDASARADEGVTQETALAWEAMGDLRRAIDTWAHRFQATGDWMSAVQAARTCLKAGALEEAWRWQRMAEIRSGGQPETVALAEELRLFAAHQADGSDATSPGDLGASREDGGTTDGEVGESSSE